MFMSVILRVGATNSTDTASKSEEKTSWTEKEIKPAEEILNPSDGKFTVPESADGEYLFSFNVNMDTWDNRGMKSEYAFYKKEKEGEVMLVEGIKIDSTAGSSHYQDTTPGSLQVFLTLKVIYASIDCYLKKGPVSF